mgnify:CR=1 FL=1
MNARLCFRTDAPGAVNGGCWPVAFVHVLDLECAYSVVPAVLDAIGPGRAGMFGDNHRAAGVRRGRSERLAVALDVQRAVANHDSRDIVVMHERLRRLSRWRSVTSQNRRSFVTATA